jgi:hypothetical protein
MEQLLITAAKIKQYRPTADIPEERISPFILEAQQLDVKPMLNELLYYDLCKNFENEKYQKLIDGGEYEYRDYTYHFEGLGSVIAYYALSRFVRSNPLHITSFGIVVKNTAQSTPASPEQIQSEIGILKSAAIGYSLEVKRFLERHSDDYPLYFTGGQNLNQNKRTAFRFFKG